MFAAMNIFKSTALYGETFKATGRPNIYSLRVYTGGFAGVKTAVSRAKKEAEKFLRESGHSSFEIVESKRVWFPLSCVDFLVGFQ